MSQLGTGDAQDVINNQLVDEADIVIGLFHSRLGRATARAESGTVEEIQRSLARGVSLHLYFSQMNADIARIDVEQLAALRQFRLDIEESGLGLVEEYASVDDLAWRVRSALEFDVAEFLSGDPRKTFDPDVAMSGEPRLETPRAEDSHVSFRMQYKFDEVPEVNSRGKVRNRKKRHRIELTNVGSIVAELVEFTIESQSAGDAPALREDDAKGLAVTPGSSVSVPIQPSFGTAIQWNVFVRWRDSTGEYTETHTVSGI